jgi:hypothetical protein
MTDVLDRERGVAGDPPVGPDEPDTGGGSSRRGGRLEQLRQPESIITLLIVVACTVFVFVQLQPSQLFRDTTPAGGDMGAHVWLPAYIKRVLLPHFQIFGWTMDWYAGFPALTYYFPLPMVAIALVSYVIPYDIAFKLVSVAGLVTLPVACWAFGRLSRMRFPGPACLAIAAVPYLFSRDFTIYGGNIASTMAGEFSFSVSLTFAVIFLGLVARGLQTGRGRAIAAIVLACCGLSHVLPLFFALGGAVVQLLMRPDRRRAIWTLTVLVVGGLLLAFWALPFEYRLPYATNMGYGKITTYLDTLFPNGDLWLFLLAGVGALLALVRKSRVGTFLLLMTVLSALVFRFAPNARLWNARVLPFWFLCLYLLVGVAFAEAGSALVERVALRDVFARRSLIPIPVVTLLVALVWTGFPLRILPFGHVTTTGKYDWLGITSTDNSFVPDWVTWNYSGYQAADKSGRANYFALIDEMKAIGATDGCGRAMYEYEPSINDMGTPDALMLLPYWTNGCIADMEGLYYESSATTPYHFLNVSELSEQPSDPMRGLDYAATPDVVEGIEHLQMFGVKYFMAVSPEVEAQAADDPSLRYLASVGPYPTDVTGANNQTTVQQQTWKIYRVLDSPLVAPLANQPVVVKGAGASGAAWLSASQSWYLDPGRWDVYEAASGPSSWARVSAADTRPPVTAEPKVTVSHIRQSEEAISFEVDRVGVPILVKTSYYPNWQVSGAGTIYRVTPNLMVVVPTSTHVSLTYGYTPVDWIGFIMTLVGLATLVLMWRRPAWIPLGGPGAARAHTARPRRRPAARSDDFWGGPDQGTAGGGPWYEEEAPVGPDDPGPAPPDDPGPAPPYGPGVGSDAGPGAGLDGGSGVGSAAGSGRSSAAQAPPEGGAGDPVPPPSSDA